MWVTAAMFHLISHLISSYPLSPFSPQPQTYQVNFDRVAVAVNLIPERDGKESRVYAEQLPKEAAEFFGRIRIDNLVVATNGWMFGVNVVRILFSLT